MERNNLNAGRHPIAAGLVSVLIVATGCSSSSDSADTSTTVEATASTSTSTVESDTTTTTVSTEDELVAAVRSFWDLYLELGARTEPFDPTYTRERLEERTTGEELERLFSFFQGNALAGYVVRGEIEVAPEVVSLEEDSAEVRDCYDDTTGLYRISTGERVDTDDPERHQVLITFALEDGVWKVAAMKDEGSGCTV